MEEKSVMMTLKFFQKDEDIFPTASRILDLRQFTKSSHEAPILFIVIPLNVLELFDLKAGDTIIWEAYDSNKIVLRIQKI